VAVIFLFYFLNRIKYIAGSEKTEGTFVFYALDENPEEGKLVYPVIEYTVEGEVRQFKGPEGVAFKLNEKVPLLLEDGNKESPLLYTIGYFWLYPLFYVILPLIVWSAFSLSYINKDEHVLIDLKYPFFKKEKTSGPGEIMKRP
jgi:hypothetical protein